MPRSSRCKSNPPKRFHPDDSELETESEAESVSDYQVTSDSEEEERSSTPDSQKDAQCGVCKKNVNSSDKSLQCDTCSEWCHIKAGTFVLCSESKCPRSYLSNINSLIASNLYCMPGLAPSSLVLCLLV